MALYTGYYDNFSLSGLGTKGTLGDYQHAARLYVDNNMRLSPKFKHLFHVVFNINSDIRSVLPVLDRIDRNEINLLCRSADLPRFSLQTETLNQYNRKKIIQTGIQYQPVTIQFHDDNAGLTTLLWELYYRYYFADGNYTTKQSGVVGEYESSSSGLNRSYADKEVNSNKYGLDWPNKKYNFFNSIQIFQLHPQNGQSTYTSFTLVNPKIDSLQHDTVSQENSEFSLNSMTISYETVLYNRGLTQEGNAPTGFAETHYDKTPSSLSASGTDLSSLLGLSGFNISTLNTISSFQNGNVQTGLNRTTNMYTNTSNLTLNGLTQTLTNVVVGGLSNILFSNSSSQNATTQAQQKKFGNQ